LAKTVDFVNVDSDLGSRHAGVNGTRSR